MEVGNGILDWARECSCRHLESIMSKMGNNGRPRSLFYALETPLGVPVRREL